MALPEEMNTEQTMRRSDKILEAKSSFDTGFHREIRQKRENGVNPKEGHPFGMVRMLIAGMLFLLLVMAFHFRYRSVRITKKRSNSFLTMTAIGRS